MEAEEQGSEVARLLVRIQAEYEAAQSGLCGLMSGAARHDFINARMDQIGQIRGFLEDIVGDHQAIALITIAMDDCSDNTTLLD